MEMNTDGNNHVLDFDARLREVPLALTDPARPVPLQQRSPFNRSAPPHRPAILRIRQASL